MVDIDVFQTVTSVSFEVEPNTNVININKVTIEGTGGGATNLSPTQTATNFTINSDTGTDATIPLGNGTLAGATINDYTTAEKNKLAGIATGAEVNVNADWNAVSGDAQILNKPTIPIVTGFVPYTGATANVNLGEFGLTSGQVTLDTTPTGTAVVGTTRWNDALGSSETTLKGGNVVLKNGVDLVARVVNKVVPNTTLTKANYQAVRVSGATGQRLSVELAQGDGDLNSADTIGLVTETIATNQEGFIITVGQIEDINTTGSLQGETWVDGNVLYLSPTIAGRLTNIKPNGSNGHIVVIGYVEYAHAVHGKIYVKIMNGWELDELHNVYINNPLNNEGLFYETSTQLWKNKSIATALGYTPYNSTNPSGYQTASEVQAIADAKVANTITNGVTTSAPNQDVVFDALALKANDANVVHLTGSETIAGTKTFSSNIVIPGTGSALILSASSGGTVSGLATTTYPDLTELTYVKGVTSAIQTQFSGKQATLISGNNIKSINGNSILGSGDLVVSVSIPSQAAYTILANNTALSAVPTEQTFENLTNQTYSGTIVWTGGTAPSGTTTHTYSLSQIGNLVTLTINLAYATAGASTLTSVTCELPSTAPTPALPSSASVVGDILNYGNGIITVAKTIPTTNAPFCALRIKSLGTPNVYEVVIARAAAAYRYAYITIQYFV